MSKVLLFGLCIVALGFSKLAGAPYYPADERFGLYGAGTHSGVVGGIPLRAGGAQINATAYGFSAANSGADNTAAVNAALDASSYGDVILIPAGTFDWNGITLDYTRNGRTLRGAGAGVTTLVVPYGSRGFTIGNDNNLGNAPFNLTGEVTGATRGVAALTLRSGDTMYDGARQMFRVSVRREIATPSVFPDTTSNYERAITVVGTGQSGTTLTLSHQMPHSYSDAFAAGNALIEELHQSPLLTSAIGIEGIYFDCTAHESDHPTLSNKISYAENCWLKDVKIVSNSNFALALSDGVNNEVTHCSLIGSSAGGPGRGGVILDHQTNGLFEDSFFDGAPSLYHWGNNVNNVFATCWFVGIANINHHAWSSHNLYEACVLPFAQSDGYYGPSTADTLAFCYIRTSVLASLKRFTRYYNFIGNISGIPGVTSGSDPDYTEHWGDPNIGNEADTGTTVQPSLGVWWEDWDVAAGRPKQVSFTLTSKTDAYNGFVTIVNSAEGDDFEARMAQTATSYVRKRTGFGNTFLHFGTRSGDVWPISSNSSGTSGIALPDAGTVGVVIAGPSGFQERDLDVLATANRVANWYVVHGNAIRSGEELSGSDTLPDSYFRSAKPAYFGNLSWPAYSPLSPPASDAVGKVAIPAGYRYINGDESYLGVSTSNPAFSLRRGSRRR